MNRVTEAIRVLFGQKTTPQQVEALWFEYQKIFDDLLKRWSAQLARDAKQEKKRIDRLSEDSPLLDRKAAARQRFARSRFGRGFPSPAQGKLSLPEPPPQQEEQEQ